MKMMGGGVCRGLEELFRWREGWMGCLEARQMYGKWMDGLKA
jgi:hypothetical protein